MKKLFVFLTLITGLSVLTGCNLLGERRYGEGDVVRVLINPAHDQSTQFFVNLRIYNDSDEARLLRIGGFEFLDGDEWIFVPPVGEYEWLFDWMFGEGLQPNDSFGSVMNFNDWLNPDYPTLGEFRAVIRVYDLDGNYQFTQASNTRTLEYFRFE